jgi:ribonucleoside-triphosphate reductase
MTEAVSSAAACKQLVRRSLQRFRLPYITVTPTFSVCPQHGYLSGHHEFCPKNCWCTTAANAPCCWPAQQPLRLAVAERQRKHINRRTICHPKPS